MKRNASLIIVFSFVSLILFTTREALVYAENSYILPYPSMMPGTRFYAFNQTWEKIQDYWSYGNFAKFGYHLKVSDKHLVEAETLLVRGQYRLGFAALEESDKHFITAAFYLVDASREEKDIESKKKLYTEASNEHTSHLNELLGKIPMIINWEEENGFKAEYNSKMLLTIAINCRRTGISFVQSNGDASILIQRNKP